MLLDIVTVGLLGLLLKEIILYGKHDPDAFKQLSKSGIPAIREDAADAGIADNSRHKPESNGESDRDDKPTPIESRYDVLRGLPYDDFVECVRIMDSKLLKEFKEDLRRRGKSPERKSRYFQKECDCSGLGECGFSCENMSNTNCRRLGPLPEDEDLGGKTVEYYFPRAERLG